MVDALPIVGHTTQPEERACDRSPIAILPR
jgi:hypothetical protein